MKNDTNLVYIVNNILFLWFIII